MEYDLFEQQQDPPISISMTYYSLTAINLGIAPFLNRLKSVVFPKMPVLRVIFFLLLLAWASITMIMVPRAVSTKTKVRGKITFTEDAIDLDVDNDVFHLTFDEIDKIRIQQLTHRFKVIELKLCSQKVNMVKNLRLLEENQIENFRKDIRKLYHAGVTIDETDLRGRKSFLLVGNRTYQEIQIIKEKYSIDWV